MLQEKVRKRWDSDVVFRIDLCCRRFKVAIRKNVHIDNRKLIVHFKEFKT